MRTEYKKVAARVKRPVSRRDAERRARRQFWQFMMCGATFVLLVAAKLWSPEHAVALRRTISGAIERNMDVQEALSTVGRTFAGENDLGDGLREVWQAVFLPDSQPENDASDALSASESLTEPDGDAQAAELSAASETLTPYNWEGSFGNSTAFASLSEPWPEASETAATAEGVTAPPSDGSAFDDTHPDAQTPILYTGQNLPENVGMQQVLLNFDYQCPVQGTLTSGFGYRQHPTDGVTRFHYGADIAAETGTDIVCFADGVVTATGESTSFGKYCTVEHGGGFTTLYAHCSKVTAISGAAVRRGEKLAEVGATGQATGPHLHFALQREGIYLNPVYYLVG